MLNLEEKKEAEIKNMVDILKQIDLPDILLLTRDANTLFDADGADEQGDERTAEFGYPDIQR